MDDKHPRGGSQTASVSSSGFRETPPQVTAIVTTKLARSQLALRFGPLQVSPCPPRAAAEGTVKMHGEQWGRKVTNPFCKLGFRAASGASPNPSQGFWKPLRAALAPHEGCCPPDGARLEVVSFVQYTFMQPLLGGRPWPVCWE